MLYNEKLYVIYTTTAHCQGSEKRLLHGPDMQLETRQEKTRQEKTRQEKTRQEKTRDA